MAEKPWDRSVKAIEKVKRVSLHWKNIFFSLFPSLPLSLSLSSFFLTLKKLQILCKAFPLPANSLYPFSGSQTHGTKAFSTKAWNESRGNRDPFENVNIVSSKGRKGKKKMFHWKKKIKFVEKYRGSTFVTI